MYSTVDSLFAKSCLSYQLFFSTTRGIVPPGDTWLVPHLHGANVLRLKLPDVMKGSIEALLDPFHIKE